MTFSHGRFPGVFRHSKRLFSLLIELVQTRHEMTRDFLKQMARAAFPEKGVESRPANPKLGASQCHEFFVTNASLWNNGRKLDRRGLFALG